MREGEVLSAAQIGVNLSEPQERVARSLTKLRKAEMVRHVRRNGWLVKRQTEEHFQHLATEYGVLGIGKQLKAFHELERTWLPINAVLRMRLSDRRVSDAEAFYEAYKEMETVVWAHYPHSWQRPKRRPPPQRPPDWISPLERSDNHSDSSLAQRYCRNCGQQPMFPDDPPRNCDFCGASGGDLWQADPPLITPERLQWR